MPVSIVSYTSYAAYGWFANGRTTSDRSSRWRTLANRLHPHAFVKTATRKASEWDFLSRNYLRRESFGGISTGLSGRVAQAELETSIPITLKHLERSLCFADDKALKLYSWSDFHEKVGEIHVSEACLGEGCASTDYRGHSAENLFQVSANKWLLLNGKKIPVHFASHTDEVGLHHKHSESRKTS